MTVSEPSPDGLGHDVGGVVDEVGVVANAAGHGVGAGAAVQVVVAVTADERVVAGVPDEGVRERVAGERRGCWLHFPAASRPRSRGEGVADAGDDRVDVPSPACAVDHVGAIVDEVGVVADAADHGVAPGAAVQRVVTGTTGQRVIPAKSR